MRNSIIENEDLLIIRLYLRVQVFFRGCEARNTKFSHSKRVVHNEVIAKKI